MCLNNSTPPCRTPVMESSPGTLADDLERFGRRILVLYGSSLSADVRSLLRGENRDFRLFEMSGAEPSPLDESVDIGASICRQERIDVLLAVGGPCALEFAVRVADRFREKDPSGRGVDIVYLAIPQNS